MVILDSGGNYLYVKESAASFTKIGAPWALRLAECPLCSAPARQLIIKNVNKNKPEKNVTFPLSPCLPNLQCDPDSMSDNADVEVTVSLQNHAEPAQIEGRCSLDRTRWRPTSNFFREKK